MTPEQERRLDELVTKVATGELTAAEEAEYQRLGETWYDEQPRDRENYGF